MPTATHPLSFSQERMWLACQRPGAGPAYQRPAAFRICGPLDAAVLERALGEVVRRHEPLRTRFPADGESPVAVVEPPRSPRLPLVGLEGADGPPEERARAWLHREAAAGFDLGAAPPLRRALLRLAPDDHVLALVPHHLVCDGWSRGVLLGELRALYAAYARGAPSPLPDLPLAYGEYARAQRAGGGAARLDAGLAYWRARLAGAPTLLELPFDAPPGEGAAAGARVEVPLSAELAAGVREAARRAGATPFMAFLAAWGALLGRRAGQRDVVVGVPAAGRTRVETEGLVGCFVNTLPVRVELDGDPTLGEVLARVRAAAAGVYFHAEVPFERIVAALPVERAPGREPLAQAFLNFRNFRPLPEPPPGPVRIDELDPGLPAAVGDLVLEVEERDGALSGHIDYRADRFSTATAHRLGEQLRRVLEALADAPGTRLSALDLLGGAERRWLRAAGTGERIPAPEGTLAARFERRARERPDAAALVHGAARLSYRELDERADRLARALRARGVRAGDRVALVLERSAALAAGILAVLKAGGVYVPLDPGEPPARLAALARAAGARLVLVGGSDAGALAEVACEGVSVEDVLAAAGEGAEAAAAEVDPEAPAYVMFTSGSTGRPKGVVVPHRAVAHLACDTDFVRLGPGDRVALAANPAFDASTFELWGALLNGATLVVLDRDEVLSPRALAAALGRGRVGTLFLTTALFHLLAREAPAALEGLENLLFGGERADPEAVRAVLAAARPRRLLHVYGPTETTTFATWHPVAEADRGGGVPIGRPLARVVARVLDAGGAEAPAGAPGELYLGGPGVALGYLDDPARTAERFVPDPFSPGARLYRTGDRVRWRADGALEFLGRLDAQVKVRGFRVEPGEVEEALRRTGLVRDAAVVAREDAAGTLALAAYVVPRGRSGPAEIRRALAATLPEHLVPAWVEVLPALPLGPTGKVARGALPPPRPAGRASAGRALTPAEERLAGPWRRVLGVAEVGPDDDFFALGGHSLLAVQLFGAIERELGERLPLSVLFRRPTLAGLAEALGRPREWSPLVEVQPGDGRAPLFVVHAADGNVLRYRALARRLGPGRPVFGLQAPGLDGREPPLLSVEELAGRYLAELRRARPAGPYHLAGLSVGGLVAFELACRLAAAGEEVGVVALFDTHLGMIEDQPWGVRARHRVLDLPRRLRRYGSRLREEGVRRAPAALRQFGTEWARKSELVRWKPGAPAPVPPLTLVEACWVAARRYAPGTYPGRLTWYVARDNLRITRLFPDWGPHAAGGVEVVPVPGSHFDLVDEPHAAAVAAHLRRALDACDAPAAARAELAGV